MIAAEAPVENDKVPKEPGPLANGHAGDKPVNDQAAEASGLAN